MVGDGGQVYLTGLESNGVLNVKWGSGRKTAARSTMRCRQQRTYRHYCGPGAMPIIERMQRQ
ncbi:MAG: FimD/PapC C-terminal domain-containing protein [Enterobacteriaceae bacterium]